MLFKQEDLVTENYDPIQEATDIINESVYLEEEESITPVQYIPVVENKRIGANVVKFEDIDRITEEYSVSYLDAMEAVAEANEISMDELAVAVPEWRIIANPSIVNELANVVLTPANSNSDAYIFCEACVESLFEDDEESSQTYEDLLVEGKLTKKIAKKKKKKLEDKVNDTLVNTEKTKVPEQKAQPAPAPAPQSQQPKQVEAPKTKETKAVAVVTNNNQNKKQNDNSFAKTYPYIDFFAQDNKNGLGGIDLSKIVQQADNQPKSWIAQKIASLRKLYQKWLKRANEEKDKNKIGKIKNVARVILNAIDKLMAKLQNATDKKEDTSKGTQPAAATA